MATHVVLLLTDVRSDKRADVPIASKEYGEAVENEDDGERNELDVSTTLEPDDALTPKYDRYGWNGAL